jgi:hypothetical protein
MSGDELSGKFSLSPPCPSKGLFRWMAYAVGDTIVENVGVAMVSGEVEIVNGREGGGIARGWEIGGWEDSVRRGEGGADAGDMVRPKKLLLLWRERWGENGGVAEEKGEVAEEGESGMEMDGGGAKCWRGVL